METYNITYSCGCIHEIENIKQGMHKPTDNNQDCDKHKKVEDD